ncbi:MAG: hypothetical protein WCO56_22790 [Verrucomicrobiota bacterium]
MNKVLEIESALQQLPAQAKWEIARWLLDDLQGTGKEVLQKTEGPSPGAASLPVALPDYAARRYKIFGNKVLPNLILTTREQERW